MARSKIETGHIKNIMNFREIIDLLISFGSRYNPSLPALQINALVQLHEDALARQSDRDSASNTLKNTQAQRQAAFEAIEDFARGLEGAMTGAGADKRTIALAASLKRKIVGSRAPGPIPPNAKSVSQRSYDQKAKNMGKLIDLAIQKNYPINEAEFQPAALTAYHNNLMGNTRAVLAAKAEEKRIRHLRNLSLYHPESGIHYISKIIKAYVKSVPSITRNEYREVRRISIQALVKINL